MPTFNTPAQAPADRPSSAPVKPGQLKPLKIFLLENGISRSRGYQLLRSGELRAVKIGARTYVRNFDVENFIAELRAYRPQTLPADGDKVGRRNPARSKPVQNISASAAKTDPEVPCEKTAAKRSGGQ